MSTATLPFPTAPAAHVAAPTRSLRVLVIDSNSVNQQLCAHMLRRLGHRSLCVADGAEAIDALDMFPFDVVLVDLDRSAGQDLEAVRSIRRGSLDFDHPWIIGAASQPRSHDYDRALEAGANDFMIMSGHFGNLTRAMRFAERSLRVIEAA